MEKSTETVIWFCGFYEGEGCVSNDKSNNNRLKVSIAQNDRAPLDIGQRIWGGSIRERVRESKNKTCHGHEWSMNHCQALIFLEDIKAYMKIPYKIKQIETALQNVEKGYKGEYRCNFCDNVYTIAANRRRHELQAHLNKDQTFECTKCGNEYKSRDSLTRHLKICDA